MTVPTLDTARLRLRAHRLEDFEAYAAAWADPVVTRHLADGATKSGPEAWTSFLRQIGQWHLLGYGSWVIEEKTAGQVVGNIGFVDRRGEGTFRDGALELGWIFATEASGKGYATEALTAVLGWGRTKFGGARVIAITAPDNVASMRVAVKCGFTEYQRALSAGRSRVFFERNL
jgi:RimJ/RimL family protein N-acetyltransferase